MEKPQCKRRTARLCSAWSDPRTIDPTNPADLIGDLLGHWLSIALNGQDLDRLPDTMAERSCWTFTASPSDEKPFELARMLDNSP